MFKMLAVFMEISVILILIMLLFYLLNKTEMFDASSASTFECGFSSFKFNRFSMSIHYFFVSLLFLFLDLEFCVILPYIYNSYMSMKMTFYFTSIMLMVLIGLLMEWFFSSLEWKI